jgi:RIO kinase 1
MSAQIPQYAAPSQPSHVYVANEGYRDTTGQFDDAEEEEVEEATGGVPLPEVVAAVAHGEVPEYQEDEEDDFSEDSEIFEDELNDQDWGDSKGDFTKQYNRQKKLVQAVASTNPAEAPKMNPQKPKANTSARVDDQMTTLSKFAGRIKLSSMEAGMSTKHAR